MTAKIAIIGSGPSGIYAMDGINKYIENCQIDVIDRLPTPFGLVRTGVAPDHLGTKNVISQYEKAIVKGDIAYFGNIEIDRDITIAELAPLYDAIIIATGAPVERNLGIAGENLDGVYGSTEFVGWYNGHPDHAQLAPKLSGASAVIIGNGNVALDIARLLVKTPDERRHADIHKSAASLLDKSNFQDVYIVGRRGPLQTSFTPPELRELAKLKVAQPVINADILTNSDIDDSFPAGRILKKNQAIFKSFSEASHDSAKTKVHLIFMASPVEIYGDEKVKNIHFELNKLVKNQAVGTGKYFKINSDIIIKAIGYKSISIKDVPFDEHLGRHKNTNGHIIGNLYVVGWGKRGPSGTIPTNRPDSFAVAKLISESLTPSNKSGRAGLNKLIHNRLIKATNFADWKKLDRTEMQNATLPKPREKIVNITEMLTIIEQD